ncbi:MAG TPA: hypothetical protein VKJ07_21620, partial [Mycobacteriales bacterium]|nr:hypothetical protein [Mycobacteriales bacterium]
MSNRRTASLVVMLILAIGALAGTFIAGNKPQLGLDLQGGASVVLKPPKNTPKDTINQAIDIIRNRVDALGVAEPQISRQGSAVVVELPGVKNQQKALQLVGTTAELRFRPVLNVLPNYKSPPTTTPPLFGATTTTTTPQASSIPTTSRKGNKANAEVVLPDKSKGSRYL